VRTASVCGNEPIVVVGHRGSFRRTRWSSCRSENGLDRRKAVARSPSQRARTSLRRRAGCARRAAKTARLASNNADDSAGRDASARSSPSSASFSVAKASQGRISGLSVVSSASETGECRSELEGASQTRSGPRMLMAFPIRGSTASYSVRQTLRASTTPRERILPRGNSRMTVSSSRGQRVLSMCSAWTGSRRKVSRLPPNAP
jgi:hypothetical protein